MKKGNFLLILLLIFILSLLFLAKCGGEDGKESKKPIEKDETKDDGGEETGNVAPKETNKAFFKSFVVETDPHSAKLNITSADGREIVAGLGAGELINGEIPLAGFAVREIVTEYEMKFGAFKPTEKVNSPWLTANSLKMTLDGDEANIALFDKEGGILALLSLTEPGNGHLKISVQSKRDANRFSLGFRCEPNDHFIGFGAQSWDVDHRGYTVPTFVQEGGIGKAETDDYSGAWFLIGRRHSSHLPIPQFLASRGYILTVKTDYRAIFALCSESPDAVRVEFEMPASLHIFDGPSPKEALEKATALFGRPRIPPSFAFAPWNDAILGSDNVRRVAYKLREKGIPTSVIWTEDWRGAEWRGDNYVLKEEWELDREIYPDFEELAEELHSLGFKFLVYFNTFVYKGTKSWDETADKGYLIKDKRGNPYIFSGAKMEDTSLIDLSNPDARKWALSKLTAAIALGADGWMGDYAEWMPTDAYTYEGDGLSQHNIHPVQWQEIQREAFDTAGDEVERLFFARSGWFGTPQLADVIWAGDQRTNFDEDDGMPTVLPQGIGLGIVGISTYGHDIAGYQSATNPPSTKELFFRWTSLAAWTPVMRTHHGYQAKLNWNWESDDETIEHFKRYAKLHIALTPYWEGLAREANETGVPIWRGLPLEFPDDNSVWAIKDVVMVGEKVLIAPIMKEGATSRSVYLPAGKWFEWEGDSAGIEGGKTVELEAKIGEIPVFAAAGAIIPMFPDGVMTLANQSEFVPGPELVGDDRIVKIFLGANGSFRESGGLSYTIEHLSEIGNGKDIEYEWAGMPLVACKAEKTPPCVEKGNATDAVFVTGNGTLLIKANGELKSKISALFGNDNRNLAFVVKR
ncbi:MAG: hypothetical protein Kow0090_16670 [Myxococcota bacterium]